MSVSLPDADAETRQRCEVYFDTAWFSPAAILRARVPSRCAAHVGVVVGIDLLSCVCGTCFFFSGAGDAGFNPLPCYGVSLYSFYFNKITITMSLRRWHLSIYLCTSSSISVWVHALIFGLLFPSASHCAGLFSENRRRRFAG